jgi:aspartate oxidase
LLEAATFGRCAGRVAADAVGFSPAADARAKIWRRGALKVGEVGEILDSAAGVIRDGETLEAAISRLRSGAVSEAASDAAELGSMICAAALARTASVGAHQRNDEPTLLAV